MKKNHDTYRAYGLRVMHIHCFSCIRGSFFSHQEGVWWYSATSGNNHILRLSITPNGTHGGGVEYTTGVTKSASYIEAGTTGAFLQLVLETDAPDLYYYCAKKYKADSIIRITGDCPLLDYSLVDLLINKFVQLKVDY